MEFLNLKVNSGEEIEDDTVIYKGVLITVLIKDADKTKRPHFYGLVKEDDTDFLRIVDMNRVIVVVI
jgi:hypothetical protein